MQATIFQSLNQIYKLNIPNRKSLPDRIWIQVQSLALSFYQVLFQNKINAPLQNTILNKYPLPQQGIRQSYTNLFYSLKNKIQRVLDFIACIICLLSDVIFVPQHVDSNEKITKFLQSIERSGQKLREYLYIFYTFQTLGCNVGKESASVIFQQFIVSKSEMNSSLTSRTRLNMQMKQLRKNMEDRSDTINIRKRLKKITKSKKESIFKEELEMILTKNKIQLEEEKKNNKKFQKFVNHCVTQGSQQFDPSLSKKSLSAVKLNDILKMMKNTEKTFRIRKKTEKQDHSKSQQYWKKVIDEMKSLCELGNTVMTQSLSTQRCVAKGSPYQMRRQKERTEMRYVSDAMLKKTRKSNKQVSCSKTIMRYNSMFPEIQERRKVAATEPSEKKENISRRNRSKDFRQEYSKFIKQRANRMIV